MSVQTIDAPVVEPELLQLSGEEARELTSKILVGLEQSYSLVIQAFQGRVWIGMSYPSWDAYCQGEFGGSALQPPREDRQEIIKSLRDAGMSLRAISSATGTTYGTVSRELARYSNAEDVSGDPNGSAEKEEKPTKITGTDGKSYSSTSSVSKQKPKPDVASKFEDVPLSDEMLESDPFSFGIEALPSMGNSKKSVGHGVKAAVALTGRTDRPLPQLIKLAGEIHLDDDALTSDDDADLELLGELATDVGRGVLALSHVLRSFDTSSVLLESAGRAVLTANVQDAVDELGCFLDELLSSK